MKYCVFNLETGIITARYDTALRDLKNQVGAGEGIYPGDADPLRERIRWIRDDEFEIVDCENEKTDDGSIWDVDIGRRLSLEEQNARNDQRIRRQISEIEAKQIRAMREFALKPSERDQDGKTAKDRLQAIDDEIASLRAQLSA